MSATQTKLGRAATGAKTPPAGPSRFAAALAGAVVRVPWRIPRLNLDTVITLVPHYRSQEIEGEVHEVLTALKVPHGESERYEAERATRYAAYAVVDPETFVPVGTLTEWQEIDDDVIGEFWRTYGDIREASDPKEAALLPEEVAWILQGLKKKEPRLLRLCGVRRLATFLLSMGDPLQNLALQQFGPLESSAETSHSPASPREAVDPATS